LKNPLLCNKFHWFHKQCSDCSAIFLFLFTACYRLGQCQWTANTIEVFLADELFMS